MPRARTEYIAVHCSATPPRLDVGVRDIRKWHQAKGWRDIGYHRVIRRNGAWEQGRPDDDIGAHVEGYNSVSIGVCLVGGTDDKGKAENNFTPAQFSTLKVVLADLRVKYPDAIVQGHRDFPRVSKACPSFDVKGWMAREGV